MTASCRSKSTAKTIASLTAAICVVSVVGVVPAFAQAKPAAPTQPAPAQPAPAQPAVIRPADMAIPGNYVIGADDVLEIVYWRDKEMSTDARVRPDGRIALPLINEVVAAGLTPEELQKKITEESKKYIEDASITVVVKEINSLKVFITGQVGKPGPYSLTSAMTVIQLVAVAGGLNEYADAKNIMIMRKDGNKQISLKFNYREVAAGKKLQQNIELKPGDTVVVP
jgi:polysaccharide export outer membrane protein